MAPLYRYLAHPIEGILNPAGQSTSSAAQRPAGRRPSIGMVASRSAVSKYQLEWDEIKYRTLVKSNEGELEKFQKEEEDAEENAGETEVMAARGKRATFYARIGDKVQGNAVLYYMTHSDSIYRTRQSQHTKQYSSRPEVSAPRSTWSSPSSAWACSTETR